MEKALPSLRDKCDTAVSEKMVPMCVEGRLAAAFGEDEPKDREKILEEPGRAEAVDHMF